MKFRQTPVLETNPADAFRLRPQVRHGTRINLQWLVALMLLRFPTLVAIALIVPTFALGAGAEEKKTTDNPSQTWYSRGSDRTPEWARMKLDEAAKACERKDWASGERLYAEVLQKAPDLTYLHAKHAVTLLWLKRTDEALKEIDSAMGADPTFADLVVAGTLPRENSQNGGAANPSTFATFYQRALTIAGTVTWLKNATATDLATASALSLDLDRADIFRASLAELQSRFPRAKETHYFRAIDAGNKGFWYTADNEFKRAEALGMSLNAISPAQREQLHNLARPARYAWLTVNSITVIGSGLFLLFAVGRVLSFLTLRSAERADPNLAITPLQRSLRNTYRLVINLAGIYYYVCLPFVILIAIGIVVGLGYLLLLAKHIPVKAAFLILAFAGAMVMMIWSSLRSLFVRLKHEDPGRTLSQEEAPRLWELTREVAGAVGTRPVDVIFLTPGTDLAVFERGTWRSRLRDQSQRSLILGLGVIDGFRTSDFRAVLAHEYGHFLHRDTAGGEVALRVNATMGNFVNAMAQGGQLAWWNIGWQFVRLYHLIFRRITHGASRLQEINADRVAARLCGRDAFEGGLRHVIRRGIVHYSAVAQSADRVDRIAGAASWTPAVDKEPGPQLATLLEAKADTDQEPWWSVYTRAETRRQTDQQIAEIWKSNTTQDDTHPSPAERIRLLSRLNASGTSENDHAAVESPPPPPQPADGFVESLFADPTALRLEQTAEVTKIVAAYVVHSRASNLQAVENLTVQVAEQPGLSRPLQERAQAKLALRDFEGVDADCCELIRLDGPNLSGPYYLRGLARSALGKNDEAVTDFRTAIQADKNLETNGRMEIGDALMQAGRPDEAATEYGLAIARSPDALGLHIRRGVAQARAGAHAEAEADFAKALELSPGSAETYALRAIARAEAGRRDEAESDLNAALAIDPAIADSIPALRDLQIPRDAQALS